MEPSVLAGLCCNLYLYGDHMSCAADALNKQQKNMLCVYVNYVGIQSLERFLSKKTRDTKHPPKKLGMLISVGKDNKGTFIGCDQKSGNHYAIAVVNLSKKIIYYGDSLGLGASKALIHLVQNYEKLLINNCSNFKLAYLHDSPQYPSQRDGNICSVVSICMLALASLKPIDFDNYLSKKNTNMVFTQSNQIQQISTIRSYDMD